MKKFLYVVGLALIILSCSYGVSAASEAYYINSNDIEMTESEYNNLVQLGFTEYQIYHMNNNVFMDNKDIEGELVSSTTKYVKTTMSIRNGIRTYTHQLFPSLSALESDMQMQTFQQPGFSPNTFGDYYDGLTIDIYRAVSSKITNIYDTYMRFKADVDWISMPTVRSNDIIAIAMESTKVQRTTGAYFEQNWITTNDVYGYDTICTPKYETTGASAVYELPTGSLSSLQSFIYFNVGKQNPNQTIYSLTALGANAHATEPVDLDDIYDEYTVNSLHGIFIYDDDLYNAYDILTAEAIFIGEW